MTFPANKHPHKHTFLLRFSEPINLFKTRLVRYSYIFRKLIVDSLVRFKWPTLVILVCGISGAFFLAAAMGQILFYARALETNTPIHLAGLIIEPRSPELFIFFSTGLLILLVVSSVSTFYSNSRIFKLMMDYESFCSKRIYLILARSTGLNAPGYFATYDNRSLLKLLNIDSRYIGKLLQLILRLIQPSLIILFAIGALFYIDYALTFFLMFFACLSFVFHYRNNLKGANDQIEMELSISEAMKIKNDFIKGISNRNTPFSKSYKVLIDESFKKGPIQSNQHYYRGRFQVIENAGFINDLTTALLIIMVLLILGKSAFSNQGSWGTLIVYLIALRYCMGQFKQMSVTFTNINRFHSIFTRYFHFIDSFKVNSAKTSTDSSRKYIIRSEGPLNETIRLYPEKGAYIALVLPGRFKFINLPTHMNCFFNGNSGLAELVLKSSRIISAGKEFLNGLSLRELFDLPQDVTLEDLYATLSMYGIQMNDIPLCDDLDNPLDIEWWNRLEPDLKYALAFCGVLFAGAKWIFIEETALKQISHEVRHKIFKQLDKQYLVIIYAGLSNNVGSYNETHAAVIDSQKLIGTGTINWFFTNKEQLSGKLMASKAAESETSQKSRVVAKNKDNLDDDLEMEM